MGSPHFAVPLCLFERSADPNFHLPAQTAVRSLANQSYDRWRAVIRGDGLSSEAEARALSMLRRSNIPAHRWEYQNLDEAGREHHLYSDPQLLWNHAGSRCYNAIFDSVLSAPGPSSHIAVLNDDDRWHPDHLEKLADAYRRVSSAGFVYTQAFFPMRSRKGGTMDNVHIWPPALGPEVGCDDARAERRPCLALRLLPPLPCFIIHPTVSFSLAGPVSALRYRSAEEQLSTVRTPKHFPGSVDRYERSSCRCKREKAIQSSQTRLPQFGSALQCEDIYACARNATCADGRPARHTLPFDADLWDRVWDLTIAGLTSVLVPTPTVTYTAGWIKEATLASIRNASSHGMAITSIDDMVRRAEGLG